MARETKKRRYINVSRLPTTPPSLAPREAHPATSWQRYKRAMVREAANRLLAALELADNEDANVNLNKFVAHVVGAWQSSSFSEERGEIDYARAITQYSFKELVLPEGLAIDWLPSSRAISKPSSNNLHYFVGFDGSLVAISPRKVERLAKSDGHCFDNEYAAKLAAYNIRVYGEIDGKSSTG